MNKLLEMRNITKWYGDHLANDRVDFDLAAGEVHALVGENGAGKTTLMKILYGMERATSGEIAIRGEVVRIHSPADAIRHGIGMVHQHFMLFPPFTVAENVVAGREPSRQGWFDRRRAEADVRDLCRRYRLELDPRRRVADCPVGIRQRVEIAKVLYRGADIIVLDEPTAVLTPLEVRDLLATVRHLAEQGKGIVIITHKLHEVMEVADRVTAMRQGRVTGRLLARDTNVEELSRLMVGRELASVVRPPARPGPVVLAADSLFLLGEGGKPKLNHVSLAVHRGEIVGIAGVSGNGQSELLRALTGDLPVDGGRISLLGRDITHLSVRERRLAGMAYIPEDRQHTGSAGVESVRDNAILGHHRRPEFQRCGWLRGRRIDREVESWVRRFGVRTPSLQAPAHSLSGGNLQKLVFARELAAGAPLLIAAEPTRGVDVGAMEFIHSELVKYRNEGGAVLLVSSDLNEVLALSDRILVMYDGAFTGELSPEEADEERVSLLMVGGVRSG
ncbi:MAG: ABC transporter ATP-binding protein [Alicyclobacillaceae bacterium]|nr:ABC transporter ATP-binding protein [Alicyclobacillaceae bacterium]